LSETFLALQCLSETFLALQCLSETFLILRRTELYVVRF
jgi:hypothetical protein